MLDYVKCKDILEHSLPILWEHSAYEQPIIPFTIHAPVPFYSLQSYNYKIDRWSLMPFFMSVV